MSMRLARWGHGVTWAVAGLASVVGGMCSPAWAGGGGENVLLIINPRDKDSLLVGNYYRNARQIPARNVLYIDPVSDDYQQFAQENVNALFGTLAQRVLEDHIDYVVVTPGNEFYIDAPGLVNDGCSPVRRFASGSVWSFAFLTDSILNGNQSVGRPNRYYSGSTVSQPFDSNTTWYGGLPSERTDAERYFIGVMLGYSGERGNTVQEILDMIDRSVLADGTFPQGTFYYMETNDKSRSTPRHGLYPQAVAAIQALGGMAEHRCCATLPNGEDDVMGVMTGASSPDIGGSGMTILPGAFCDHLTSYAGRFDTGSQTKMSEWIRHGASGSMGTVEEPCNYAGKFPSPRMHVYYYQGSTLGEAAFRSLAFIPFQALTIGDPLTQPFTHIPQVTVDDAPSEPVSGIVTLTPEATTTHPDASIDHFDLHVNGQYWLSVQPGRAFMLDTTRLNDGYHDLRVLAFDDSNVRSTGRWTGTLQVNNHGRSATLMSSLNNGIYRTRFDFTIAAQGGTVQEFRLMHNGRVLGAKASDQEFVPIHGAILGAGEVELQAEVQYTDGGVVLTPPITVNVVDDESGASAIQPTVFSYTKRVLKTEPFVVELPGTFNQFTDTLGYELLTQPAQSTVLSTTVGPYRVMQADPDAAGTDTFTYQWTSQNGTSNHGTITLVYDECIPGQLELSIGPVRGGQNARFDLSCGYPNELAYLIYSLAGEGSQYVPQLNVTLGLRNPAQAGSARRTDSNGFVRWNLPIPDVNPRPVWFQAAQRSATSNVVEVQLQ